jgi:hypothetical protein|tara:strand:+ start:1225 stop:1479 length:255 start_codon:yes stop_codon:yes gene_type:complete
MALKVEGTIEELQELFGSPGKAKRKVKSVKKSTSKTKRPLNSWQKFVKANSSKYKFKTTTANHKKNQINLKAMSRDFKKGGKKK